MSTDTLTPLFALLTFVCAGATVVSLVVVVGARFSPADSVLSSMCGALGDLSLWLAWLVAATTTVGSMYYSIGAHYTPCELCWYQRICMYPLVVILGVGAWKRAPFTRLTALPFIVCGIGVSTWHFILERFPGIEAGACSITVPCNAPWFVELGFITLAFMCLSGMALIATLLLVDRAHERATQEVTP